MNINSDKGSRYSPYILLLLAPAIPELLTGSTPYYDFINPLFLVLLIIIYGFPVVLIREYSVRFHLNYNDIMFLGIIVGFLIEGLAVNTFYDPRVERIGNFAIYCRIYGINLCWSIYLTFFHSIFSVLIPIVFVESLYPGINSKEFINTRFYKYMIIAVIFVTILFNLAKETYNPPIYYQLILLIITITYLYIIHRIYTGKSVVKISIPRIKYPLKLLITYPPVFIILALFISSKILPEILHILLGIVLYLALYNTLKEIDRNNYIQTWYIGSRLLLGLCINGFLIAIFNNQYYILVPVTIFTVIVITVDHLKKYR